MPVYEYYCDTCKRDDGARYTTDADPAGAYARACPITSIVKHGDIRKHRFVRQHSLSIAATSILILWIVLYSVSSPSTYLGSFFGNAIADWSGVVVMVFVTKYLYEKGGSPGRGPRSVARSSRLATAPARSGGRGRRLRLGSTECWELQFLT
jgi:hypothetical protein